MQKLTQLFFLSLIVVAVLFVFGAGVINASDRNAKIECLKWQKYSGSFSGFYLLGWQKMQCDSVGIIISAPVK